MLNKLPKSDLIASIFGVIITVALVDLLLYLADVPFHILKPLPGVLVGALLSYCFLRWNDTRRKQQESAHAVGSSDSQQDL